MNTIVLYTLATQTGTGQFDDAVRSAPKAMELARPAGRPDSMEHFDGVKLYVVRLLFHQQNKWAEI